MGAGYHSEFEEEKESECVYLWMPEEWIDRCWDRRCQEEERGNEGWSQETVVQ